MAGENLWKPGTKWWNILSVIFSMIGYAFLINFLGFRLVTFLWTGFMCRGVGRMGWKATSFTSVVTTIFSTLLFEYGLSIRLPRGILGF
jgi:hypothetical protein